MFTSWKYYLTHQEDIILELGNRKYYIAPGIMFVLYNIQ